MKAVSFTIPGRWVPENKRSVRRGRARVDMPEAEAYKELVRVFAGQAMRGRKPFNQPIKVHCVFSRPKPKHYRKHENYPWKKPDIDNCIKIANDGMEGRVFMNDSAICDLHVQKVFGPWQVTVTVEPLGEWPYG